MKKERKRPVLYPLLETSKYNSQTGRPDQFERYQEMLIEQTRELGTVRELLDWARFQLLIYCESVEEAVDDYLKGRKPGTAWPGADPHLVVAVETASPVAAIHIALEKRIAELNIGETE